RFLRGIDPFPAGSAPKAGTGGSTGCPAELYRDPDCSHREHACMAANASPPNGPFRRRGNPGSLPDDSGRACKDRSCVVPGSRVNTVLLFLLAVAWIGFMVYAYDE